MKISTVASANSVTREALDELTRKLQVQLGAKPDFLAVYYAEVHESDSVAHQLSSFAGEAPVHGGTSCLGVMTQSGFHGQDGSGIGLFGISDPDGDYGTGAATMGDDPRKAATTAVLKALDNAGRTGEMPDLIWLNAAPGKEEKVLAGIEDVLGKDVPIGGGSTGDNSVSGNWNQIANGEVFDDAVVASAFFPSVELSYSFHSGYDPTETTGSVTRAEGRTIQEIDSRPAAEVYNEWTGGSIAEVLETGGNVLALTTLNPIGRVVGKTGGVPYYKLSHPDGVTPEGGLSLFSEISVGDKLVLMHGSRESLINRAGRTANSAITSGDFSTESVAGALVIYCAGCMLTIQQDMDAVASEVNKALGGKPFIGIFTFGEQGCFLGNENTHGNLMISVVAFSQ